MITVTYHEPDSEGVTVFSAECQTTSEADHVQVLLRAAVIFAARNEEYQDNWRRQGWRGNLFKLRLKVERAWDVLWGWAEPSPPSLDDLLDAINCAAFAIRCIEAGDRDGEWSYPGEQRG